MTILTCSGCKRRFEPRVFDGEIQIQCDHCLTVYAFTADDFNRRWLAAFLRKTNKRRAS